MERKTIKRRTLQIMKIFLTAYLAICILVYLCQDHLIYFPDAKLLATPADIGLPFETLRLTTTDNVSISAWYVPAASPKGVILFCHGNAGNISHRLESLRIFHEMGYSVLLFDYRGYGESTGTPSENGTYRDAECAWAYLTNTRKIKPTRIILFGRSLGGAVAAHLAGKVSARALILESTFTSLPDRAGELYPFLPVRILSRYSYNTKSILPRLTMPILIIHSREDEMIPFSHAESLFNSATQAKTLTPITGTHNSRFLTSREAYTKSLMLFLASHEDR